MSIEGEIKFIVVSFAKRHSVQCRNISFAQYLSPSLRKLKCNTLQEAGYKVPEAEDASKAIEIAHLHDSSLPLRSGSVGQRCDFEFLEKPVDRILQ